MHGNNQRIFRALNSAGQLSLLSILWVICCLPVVTIGASSAALYYTTVKVVRRDRGKLLESFFSCFRENFWLSLPITMFYLSGFAVLAFFALPALSGDNGGNDVALCILIGLTVLLLLPFVFSYPVISRFYYSGAALARFLLLLSGRYFYVGIACILMLLAGGAIVLSNGAALLFVPGIYVYIKSWMLEPIFRKYSSSLDTERYECWYGGEQDDLN